MVTMKTWNEDEYDEDDEDDAYGSRIYIQDDTYRSRMNMHM